MLLTDQIGYSRILFIIWNKSVRAYSTITGEWIRDLEGPNEKLVGHQCDPLNSKLLYACSQSGEVIAWKWKSGVINSRVKLKLPQDNVVVGNFVLIEMRDKRSYGLITWRNGGVSTVQIGVFDLADGTLQEVKIPIELKYVTSNKFSNSTNLLIISFAFPVSVK